MLKKSIKKVVKKPIKKEKKKIEPKKKFIQKAVAKMKAKGTLGKFSKAAKKEGETTLEHAEEVKSSPKASSKVRKEAQFAINMSKINKKKK